MTNQPSYLPNTETVYVITTEEMHHRITKQTSRFLIALNMIDLFKKFLPHDYQH